MPTETVIAATLDDLYRVEGKAELIGGRIVHYEPNGVTPSRVALRVTVALHEYAKKTGKGDAYTGGIGFAVEELPSGRQSFSPDASYYLGPLPENRMRFIEGAPTFAVEVRGENDYGKSAEAEMAAKRDDYFEAGTVVVWDVDCEAKCIRKYAKDNPHKPMIFGIGMTADAEPAVCDWKMEVNNVLGIG